MKKLIGDLLYCLKIALYIFVPVFILGFIIGFIMHGTQYNKDIIVACKVSYIVGVVGLALAGLSFIKQDLMRPLNYQKEWETYFSKLSFAHVSFLIGFYILVIAAVIEILAY